MIYVLDYFFYNWIKSPLYLLYFKGGNFNQASQKILVRHIILWWDQFGNVTLNICIGIDCHLNIGLHIQLLLL